MLSKLPARFEANVGQASDGVAYTLKAKGYVASLSPDAIHFGLSEGQAAQDPRSHDELDKAAASTTRRAVVSMRFIDANDDPVIEAADPQEGISNYFLGNDPTKWHTNVGGFSKVYYRDLYPGIDMVIYDDSGQARYDFVVAPGADPSQIAFEFEGANGLAVSDSGDLVVTSPYGDLTHKAPFAYQGEDRTEVRSRFEIRDGATAGFGIGAYDNTRPLVIDPSLVYSTYLGGGSYDASYSVAAGLDGAVFVAGETASSVFPTAVPLQATNAGGDDAFVTKVTASGSALEYSTYLGGTGLDDAYGIAVDSTGSAYLTGYTSSSNFPTAVPLQAANAGGDDAIVVKINPAGSALTYSTYLGGSGADYGLALAVDSSGAAYISGKTASLNFPTASAVQAVSAGGDDAFVAKLAASGQSLVYSTFVGGSSTDYGRDVALDQSGAAYVTGWTSSTDFPSTGSAFQTAYGGGPLDAFVFKVVGDGQSLAYSGYLGGDDEDYAWAIAVDGLGAAYVTGSSATHFPVVGSPFQSSPAGGFDAFVAKIAPSGQSLAYSTYVGGNNYDRGNGIAVDSAGAAYVTGRTQSTNFPVLGSPIQGSIGGGFDAFITRLDPSGASLSYSTYIGGSLEDYGAAVAVDGLGAAFVTGYTDSANFPTVSPFQAVTMGARAAFVAKISGATISGSVANSAYGAISIYSAASGAPIAYVCCTDSDAFTTSVPPSGCPGGGYKILATAPPGYQSRWYNNKDNWSEADCVDAPSTDLSMTLPAAEVIEGDITDAATGLPIDGAYIYAFKADGTFANWTQSGNPGSGHFKLELAPGETYKLLVVHGSIRKWFGGSTDWTNAATCTNPCTANVSIDASSPISGYVKSGADAADVDGVLIYVWNSDSGQFAGWTKSGLAGPGRYSLNLPTGSNYKVLARSGDEFEDLWSDGAPGYMEASPVAPPASANFSLREAGLITGTATAPGGGPRPNALVAAYTTCGCTTPMVALSGPDGSYTVKVASTGASGWQYKVRFIGPSGGNIWYDSTPGFTSAGAVSSPSSGVNQEVPD